MEAPEHSSMSAIAPMIVAARIATIFVIAVLIVPAAIAAWAASIQCTSGVTCEGTKYNDVITGTETNDKIYGYWRSDKISSLGGDDTIYGGRHSDSIYGGSGID